MSLLQEHPARFEPTDCPLLQFLQFLLQIDLTLEQGLLFGLVLGNIDQAIQMGIQEAIEPGLNLGIPLGQIGLTRGNRLARLGPILGPCGKHLLKTIVRQSDLGDLGAELFGQTLFPNERLSAFAALFRAAIIMMPLLSLCRNGTPTGKTLGQAKEREIVPLIFVRATLSHEHFLHAVEEFFGK